MPDLRTDLEARLAGEVRFDAVSRALYSTDASVYRIEPLGVAIWGKPVIGASAASSTLVVKTKICLYMFGTCVFRI